MTGSMSTTSEGWRNARSWCALLTLVTVFAAVRGHNWMGGGWRYPLLSTGDSSEELSLLHSPGYGSYARAGYNTGYNNGYNTRFSQNYHGQPSNSGYNPGYGRYPWYGYSNHPVGVGWGQQNSGGSAMSRTTWGHALGSKSGDSSAQGEVSAGRRAGEDSSSEEDSTGFLGGLLAGLGGGGSSHKEHYSLISDILARARGGNDGSQSADVSLARSDDEGDVSDDVAEVVVGGRQPEAGADSNNSEGDDVGDNDSRGSDSSERHVISYPTTNCQAAMDVAVLVDLSQRASAPDVTQVQISLGDLVDNLHVQSGGRHMAVMTYGAQVLVTSALSGNAGQLKTDIARLTPAGGAADMALALQSMRDLLTLQGRPSVSKACVLITDERATSSQMAARQAALARMAGIQMLVVAVGQDLDVADLRQVADDDDYHLLFAEGFLDLAGLTGLISSTLCSANDNRVNLTESPYPEITETSPAEETKILFTKETEISYTEETKAPLAEKTDAPYTEQTDTTLIEETDTPYTKETGAPLTEETDGPYTEETDAPLTEETDGPYTEETEAPLTEETDGPYTEETEALPTEETDGPYTEETEAPLTEETEAPLTEETDGPLTQETDAPLTEETEAPLTEETDGPYTEETNAPLTEETEAPLTEETDGPYTEETNAPLTEETEAPLTEETGGPYTEETNAPLTEETEAPLTEETDGPYTEETGAPLIEETDGPYTEETEAPLTEETDGPYTEETEAPLTEETEAPLTRETDGPLTEETGGPYTEETDAPLTEETDGPLTEETDAPLTEETGAPLTEETDGPYTEETNAPLTEETEAPLTEDTDGPYTEETEAPLTEETDGPYTEETNAPLTEETEAPLPEETDGPYTEETGAPLTEETDGPYTEETGAPLTEETDGPYTEETEAPLTEETDGPYTEETEAPLTEETEAPLTEETDGPYTEETEAPLTEETEAPLTEETGGPYTEETDAPLTEETEAPLTEETGGPYTEETDAPLTEETEAPLTEETDAPYTEETDAPYTEETEAPYTEATATTLSELTGGSPNLTESISYNMVAITTDTTETPRNDTSETRPPELSKTSQLTFPQTPASSPQNADITEPTQRTPRGETVSPTEWMSPSVRTKTSAMAASTSVTSSLGPDITNVTTALGTLSSSSTSSVSAPDLYPVGTTHFPSDLSSSTRGLETSTTTSDTTERQHNDTGGTVGTPSYTRVQTDMTKTSSGARSTGSSGALASFSTPPSHLQTDIAPSHTSTDTAPSHPTADTIPSSHSPTDTASFTFTCSASIQSSLNVALWPSSFTLYLPGYPPQSQPVLGFLNYTGLPLPVVSVTFYPLPVFSCGTSQAPAGFPSTQSDRTPVAHPLSTRESVLTSGIPPSPPSGDTQTSTAIPDVDTTGAHSSPAGGQFVSLSSSPDAFPSTVATYKTPALRTSARPATSATKTITRIPQTSPIITSKRTVRPTTLMPSSRPPQVTSEIKTIPVTQNPSTSSSGVSSAKTPGSTSSRPIKSTQWTTSEKTTPPGTQRLTPSTEGPISSTQRPTPSTQRPIPSTQRPTLSTQRPTPSTQRPTPSTQRPTPSTQRPIPSTQRPTPSTQRTTSPKITLPGTHRPTPSTIQTTPKKVTTQRPPTSPTTRRTIAPSTQKPSTSTPHITSKRTTVSPTQRPSVSTPRVTSGKTTASTTQRPTRTSTSSTSLPQTVTSPVPEQTTLTQRIPEICDGCTMVNGVGYKAHWSACDLFVQCVFAADGSATVSIRQCPHGLHWDQAALTCNHPSLAACPQDMCRQSGYILYPATSNCRGFWACEGGVSEGKCCPPGYTFSMDGECVPSPSCQDPCGVAPTVTNDVCDKRAVATMPLVFEQYVAGAGWQLMFCAPSTAYNHSQCACTDHNPAVFEPPDCRAELYIPFNDGVARDESGNNNFVQNDGVKVSGGVGYFDGSAVLRVPRFSNSDYGDVLLVRLRYKQDTAGTSSSQALVANGDCLKPSSLYLAADHQGVHFGVRTSTGQSPTVVVPESSLGWKEAVLYIDRQLLTGSVNNFSKQTLFTGSLDSSKCALQVGRGTNFQNFKGIMDDITVYLCRPKTL